MIHIVDSARFRIDRQSVKHIVLDYLAKRGVSGEMGVNIIFVGKRKMLYIATVYKREPVALPVLTFAYRTTKRMMHRATKIDGDLIHEVDINDTLPTIEHDSELLGEIFICFPQAVLLAAERNKKVIDILAHLIEHGIDNLIAERAQVVPET